MLFKRKPLDKQELLHESNTFCMLPWVHLYSSPQGKVTPCCLSKWEEEHTLGNINDTSFESIWNGRKMCNVRKKMLNNKEVEGCWQCYENERLGIKSKRIESNKLYESKFSWVKTTDRTGVAPDAKPIYWDIRISNLCNFKYRICAHHSSSKWFEEANKLGEVYSTNAIIKGVKNFDALLTELEFAFDELEEIYFAGGEPLIMDEHYTLLNKLIKAGKTDVKLRYATNFSVSEFKEHDVFEIWKKFDHVWVHASLDGSNGRGEFQRKGQKWSDVIENRKRLMKVAPNVNFMICSAISAYNVIHLPSFHKEWVEKGLIELDDFLPHLLKSPEKLSIQILNESLKEEVRKIYETHLAWLVAQSNSKYQKLQIVIGLFEAVLSYMNAEDKSHLMPEFKTFNDKLDVYREESLVDVLPELTSLYQT